ncbi:MAG: diphosphomevalonate decarboxylase [Levilactobacillus sp.]|jgi:diphosphomevalonate decarboxylase|uniref:diphosphomevalonate decarboxylase n=1 Tax=Levilactobacillus sp. TaxID=2767919 RepID=UPI00258B356A|nr:diphosphomevalonate decarboxylase [Levilactobacillus sp.]MCH4123404.1 diphosphomevalonate decarboxylase [Levilactobacillus sp.]MCI1552458.1 diphosphomevalonate decarboxylase [Levilactobacillus sp.]MCI1599045.1 diphosphomevalonate decarboxylase [Levilactobacillus sp.]
MTAVTARAHTNIALVKYWGKADTDLIIPQTSSLSLTLDQFYTDTTVAFDADFTADTVILNDHRLSRDASQKVRHFLDLVRQMSGETRFATVTSTNHVPTAAGLASSASAFAALAGAASRAAGMELSRADLSRLARRGSGSATRSIFGGFVEWQAGHDDHTSVAVPFQEQVDWPIAMVALLLDPHEKKVSSRQGMQSSVTTSPYYPAWKQVVAADLAAIKPAILAHDFTTTGEILEANAMRMHALTLSANPPYSYFNGDTLTAMQTVRDLRAAGVACYYTLDAGPNLKVFCQTPDLPAVTTQLAAQFGADRLVVAHPGPGIQFL